MNNVDNSIVTDLIKIIQDSGGKVMNILVSGSHLYGFPSVDSDFDIRGSYVTSTKEFLGLRKPKDELRMTTCNYDIALNEIAKELGLAIKGNCNVLEHFFAPQLYESWHYKEFRDRIAKTIHKEGLYNSYRGMAAFNYKKFLSGEKKTAKKFLYVMRALMCGTYVLETGIINPNLYDVNTKRFNFSIINKLIEQKINGEEIAPNKQDIEEAEKVILKLFTEIDTANRLSFLPIAPEKEAIAHVESYLVELRKYLINNQSSY